MARATFTYQLIGFLQSRKLRKNKKHSTPFYQLNISCETDSTITKIFVFKAKLTNPTIWTDLPSNSILAKRYLFYCRNYYGSYYLINWEEMPNGDNEPSSKPTNSNSWTSAYF
jgi:hypothetical protein